MLAPSELASRVEADNPVVVPDAGMTRLLQWGPIIAGALLAAAVAAVLLAFGTAIGLGVVSFSPSWRDTSPALTIVTGLYLLLTALVSYGLGGYLAGRVRRSWDPAVPVSEIELRDGVHGVVAWAVGVVITSLLLAIAAAGISTKAVAPAEAANATSGQPIIAYQLDRLFRAVPPRPLPDSAYMRAEAGRILLTSTGRRGVAPEDQGYLAQLVARETGLAPPAAESRVETAISATKAAVGKARKTAVILGFSTAASLLLGAAAAWGAATAGGRHRDDAAPPYSWRWPRARSPA